MGRRARVVLRAAGVVAAALLASVVHAQEEEPEQPSNILLVTLDTTRADHLGCYGWSRARTPVLDTLAARGSLFERCDASAPITLPSHATILTGQYPPRHGVRDNGTFSLDPASDTLAELLKNAGYDTAAVVSAVVLARRHGLDQGFRVYDDDLGEGYARGTVVEERDARRTTDRALQVLAGLSEPYFLWVHYFDPHEEYRPPTEWLARVHGPTRAYDGEIAFVDHQLGRLLEAVGTDCMVAVAGDHGEMLGDHGEPTHGVLPYAGSRRVPLLFAGPGVPAGLRVEELVRTADIAPTLLEAVSVAKLRECDGISLVPMFEGRQRRGRTSYTEAFMPFFTHRWYPLRAMSDGRWLYLQAPLPGLYDLRGEGGEGRDLAAQNPGLVARWQGRLQRLLAEVGEELDGPVAGGATGLAADEIERLAALGYVTGADGGMVGAGLPDPRAMMDLVLALDQASGAIQQRQFEQALPLLQPVLERSPRSIAALNLAGVSLFETGKAEQALELFRRAARESPRSPHPVANAASCLLELGRVEEAEQELRRVLEIDPSAADAAVKLARLMRKRDQLDAAVEILDGVIAAGGRRPEAYLELGVCAAVRGDLDGALGAFREAAVRDPTNPAPLENAATAAYQLERFPEAAQLYEQMLRLVPERGDAWKSLGAIYLYTLNRPRDALRCFRAALRDESNAEERATLRELVKTLEAEGG